MKLFTFSDMGKRINGKLTERVGGAGAALILSFNSS